MSVEESDGGWLAERGPQNRDGSTPRLLLHSLGKFSRFDS